MKIKNRLLGIAAVVVMCFTLPSLAANQSKAEASTASEKIILYASPISKTVLEELPANTNLIPIYRKKNWVKVGDPRNGKVGWVNRAQVRKARQAFFRPNIQTVYINTSRGENGKPELNIVAYKNGKQLSPQQAKELYKRMRKQQQQEMRSMQQAFHTSPMFFQPMIVLPDPAQPASNNDDSDS